MARAIIPEFFERPATPRSLDFRDVRDTYYIRDERGLMQVVFSDNRKTTDYDDTYVKGAPMNSAGKVLDTRHQIRRRANRRLRKGVKLTDAAFADLMKPIDEWDNEELARGRPRDSGGGFRGPAPKYISREMHERIMERFRSQIRLGMNVHSVSALDTIDYVLTNVDEDDKGKPLVGAGTKLDAAKFLLEHVIGKPVQPTTSDISVKLQGILGAVMVTPQELAASQQQYKPAHMGSRGELTDYIDAEEVDEDDE